MPETISNKTSDVSAGTKPAERGMTIAVLDEPAMLSHLPEIMNFVNSIRSEFDSLYGWKTLEKDYFVNSLIDKFKYSSIVYGSSGDICLVNFSSLYNGDTIHMHGTYVDPKHRGMGLAKNHMMYLCRTAKAGGIRKMEGYWPKNNNGSIILHLLMGWYIDSINDEKKCVKLTADPENVAERTAVLIDKKTSNKNG